MSFRIEKQDWKGCFDNLHYEKKILGSFQYFNNAFEWVTWNSNLKRNLANCLGKGMKKTYSHLSNKRGAHAYRFWKIPPSTFIVFMNIFQPPRLHYLVIITIFSPLFYCLGGWIGQFFNWNKVDSIYWTLFCFECWG